MPAKQILLLEDEALVALDIESTLTELGYAVHCFSVEPDARSALETTHFDLMILDYHLKTGTADATARLAREKGIPIIVCSGSVQGNDLALELGHSAFLPKPFNSDQLIDLVIAHTALFPKLSGTT